MKESHKYVYEPQNLMARTKYVKNQELIRGDEEQRDREFKERKLHLTVIGEK